MKITKKEIREFLKECREVHGLGWNLVHCGFYVSDGKLDKFIEWDKGGTPEVLYNSAYDDVVFLEQYCNKREYTLVNATELAFEEVIDMIKEQPFLDTRELNVVFTKGGSGSITNKLNIPSTWIRTLGITEESKEVIAEFDGEEIRIRKK